jgi:hypothetical protein
MFPEAAHIDLSGAGQELCLGKMPLGTGGRQSPPIQLHVRDTGDIPYQFISVGH